MAFDIKISPSGHHCQSQDGETVLEAALNAGFLLPYNCRNGTCGACKGKVLSGKIDPGRAMDSVLLPSEREAGEALFCCATPLSDLTIECREFEAPGEIKVKQLLSKVKRMYVAAPDVMVVQLELAASKRLQFLAGQYVDILLDDGQRRAFSLATAPHDDEILELHIRRMPGGQFTGHVFEELRVRDSLKIEGPFGNFYLRETSEAKPDQPIIMIAGGTGFAPVKSMVEHAIHRKLQRSITIYWGARNADGLYMHDLALDWAAEHENIRYIPVVSEPGAGDDWRGRTGMVHQAVLDDFADLSGSDVYLCGSEQMTIAARRDFVKRGLPETHLYCDVFCSARQLVLTE